ncbi:glycosyltransferase family 1 protein [Actinomycetota bacterium]
MDNNCIRILRIVAIMNRGGIETQIMNMYRKLNRNRFQFDFLVTRDERGVFDDEIEKLGGRIYRVPSVREVGLFKFIKNINRFFKEHREYKIVHSHMNTWSGLFLNIAKKHNVSVRIAQSHITQLGVRNLSLKGLIENILKKFMKIFIKTGATHFWAVGKEAGEWLYGKKIAHSKMKIIPNSKDLNAYKFDSEARGLLRKDLGIPKNAFVVGHVGRFYPVKNHLFLIELFSDMRNYEQECFLCLVGDGPLRSDIEKEITEKNLKGNVLVLGLRNDVNKLMSVFDVLVLPSKFEGMPNVVVEAQAAALPCVVSDSVTKEVDMGMGIVEFLSLKEKKKEWSNIVFSKRIADRFLDTTKIKDKGYDLDSLIQRLQDFYISGLYLDNK